MQPPQNYPTTPSPRAPIARRGSCCTAGSMSLYATTPKLPHDPITKSPHRSTGFVLHCRLRQTAGRPIVAIRGRTSLALLAQPAASCRVCRGRGLPAVSAYAPPPVGDGPWAERICRLAISLFLLATAPRTGHQLKQQSQVVHQLKPAKPAKPVKTN